MKKTVMVSAPTQGGCCPVGAPGVSRRAFLKRATATALAAPFILPAGAGTISPGGKLSHASSGCGGMGVGDLQNFSSHPKVQITALCDVDANTLQATAKKFPNARLYSDWRELLEKEGDKIDSVNATVPDHMHFAVAYSAIMKGKNVYCQKPLCHDVAEVRALTQAAAQKGAITQLGTQMAANVGERTAVQWLREGVIGKVTHVYLCANRPGAVDMYRARGPRPAQGQPPPKNLNWEVWVGTAPMRPYVPDLYQPVKWRAWQDFGTGWSGDIGCHIFDAVWKGLGLTAPRTAYAKVQETWRISKERRADTWPQGQQISWVFPGNELTGGKDLPVEWYDGEFDYPPDDVRRLYTDDFSEYPGEAALCVGTEGALLYPLGGNPMLLPETKFKGVVRPKLPPRNHYHHFVDAIFDQEKNESHFAQVGPMTEAILLGTIAVRVPSTKLEWDAPTMRVTNVPEANHYVQRTYRDGWKVGPF